MRLFLHRFFHKKITISKWKFNLFGVVFIFLGFVAGSYFTVSNWVIPEIFATVATSVSKYTDTHFNQGISSDVEVSGSGTPAVLQLEGDGGAGWFNASWLFRQPVTITNSGSAQTDYAVRLAIIYNAKMQPDFDDLRFANSSGTELDYWLQSKTDSTSAVVWVEVDSLAGSGDTIIYMYYNNVSASSGSDGEAAFLLFDDFNDGTVDTGKWVEVDQVPPGEIYESGGELIFSRLSNDTWNKTVYSVDAFSRSDLSFEMDYEWTSDNGSWDALMMGWHDNTAGTSYTNLVYGYYNAGDGGGSTVTQRAYEDGSSRGTLSGHSWTQNTDYDVRIRMRESGGAYYEYSTDSGQTWTTAYTSSYSTESNLHPGWAFYSGTHEYDNARLRKWMSTEPSSVFGTEQAALASSGTWESPTDSNVIDVIYNGGWGDGSGASTAFSATVADVGANSSITFSMRSATTAVGLSSASYATLGIASSGTTFIRNKTQLDALSIATGTSGRYIQVKAELASTDGVTNPKLDDFFIFYLADNTPPEVNATSLVMQDQLGGTTLTSNAWTNGNEPYFSWTAGSDSESGLKGYCLYLGQDGTANPATAKGILGTSPLSTAGTTCQFIVNATSIDLATEAYQGSTWLTSSANPYYLNIKAIDMANNIVTASSLQF